MLLKYTGSPWPFKAFWACFLDSMNNYFAFDSDYTG